jgi:hypothetical protein
MKKNLDLKAEIVRRFGTQGAFAKALKWDEAKLSRIINGWIPPEPERRAMAKKLQVPVEQIFSL